MAIYCVLYILLGVVVVFSGRGLVHNYNLHTLHCWVLAFRFYLLFPWLCWLASLEHRLHVEGLLEMDTSSIGYDLGESRKVREARLLRSVLQAMPRATADMDMEGSQPLEWQAVMMNYKKIIHFDIWMISRVTDQWYLKSAASNRIVFSNMTAFRVADLFVDLRCTLSTNGSGCGSNTWPSNRAVSARNQLVSDWWTPENNNLMSWSSRKLLKFREEVGETHLELHLDRNRGRIRDMLDSRRIWSTCHSVEQEWSKTLTLYMTFSLFCL